MSRKQGSLPPIEKGTIFLYRFLREAMSLGEIHYFFELGGKVLREKGYDFDKSPHEAETFSQELLEHILDSSNHERILNEMILVRSVDNFLSYLSELLGLIFKHKPQVLKSNAPLSTEWVLEHTTIEELVNALAEKKVNELAFLGLKKLSEFFEEKMKLPLIEGEPEGLLTLIQIVEARNLITHNRGIVNDLWISRVAGTVLKKGARLELTRQGVLYDSMALAHLVISLDSRAITKFQLPGTSDEDFEKENKLFGSFRAGQTYTPVWL